METENSKEYLFTNITNLCSCNGMNKPEFRLTEIKSSMRFWWRALGTFKNADEMKKKEDNIFGSSSTSKSPIMFRITKNEFIQDGNYKSHDVGKKVEEYKILKRKIPCFLSGTNVRFKISVFKRLINENSKIYNEKNLLFYDNLLKLSMILGGIGKRSRRGCGAFKIDGVDVKSEEDIVEYIMTFMKNIGLENSFVRVNSNKLFKYLEIQRNDKVNLQYPYVEEIIISKEPISEQLYYGKIKCAIDNTRNKKNLYTGKHGRDERLACPVYVTCYGDNNKLYPIIVKLNNTHKSNDYQKYYDEFKEAIL